MATKVDIIKIVLAVLNAQAAKSSTDMTKSDVPVVAQAVTKEVNSVVTNLTNQEPWYQSRVIIGLGISLALKAAGIIGWATDAIDADQLTAQIMLLVSVLGDMYAMYGRLVVNKPIGE